MSYKVCSFAIILLIVFLTLTNTQAGHNANLKLTQAERDSILKDYDNIFPIWGRKAIEKGFDLPYPVGININFLYMHQDIAVSNLGLSVNENPIQSTDFITFDKADSRISTVNGRLDLWVFPFLNVYGLLGRAASETKVKIKEPVVFESSAEFSGNYYGFGLTTAIGIFHNWLSFDINWAWTDLDKLNEPVRSRIFGLRYGRTIEFSNHRKLAIWVGTMNQKLLNTTTGTVLMSEVLPPELEDQLADYQNSEWYQNLDSRDQAKVDAIMDRVLNDFGGTSVNYSLDKQPDPPWNILIGGQYEFNKHWQVRAEVGFLKRFSILLNANYRFNL
jgi:hypothetical protein